MGESVYRIAYLPDAAKAIRKLDAKVRARLLDAIGKLAANPRPPGVKKLQGVEAYRIRVGDYRVIYSVADGELLVLVFKAGHRREVYKK